MSRSTVPSYVVRAFGGEVRIVGYVPAHSTTELVERIRAVERE